MKRWLLLALVGIISMSACLLILHQYLTFATAVPQSGLLRTPHSAYKYKLCTEAFAFAHATSENPYKTDYAFQDPFRNAEDTIIPRLLDYNQQTQTANFNIDVIIKQVATFHEAISLVHELDGISVILPDKQNHLQSSAIPQLVVSSLGAGKVAVLDYTCPDQWRWRPDDSH